MQTLAAHEAEAYVERLKRQIDAFMRRHDTPRSDARPLHDKYSAVYEINELTK